VTRWRLRLVLDHPESVRRVAFLDCLPISEHLSRVTAKFATAWRHWFFFAQPDTPERVINADPGRWYHGEPAQMGAENHREWREAVRYPNVVRAMLEDYHAGLAIDRRDEEVDRDAGNRIGCPALVLWSLRDDLEDLYGDPVRVWRPWADDVTDMTCHRQRTPQGGTDPAGADRGARCPFVESHRNASPAHIKA
jgi:haloacetate dehalogenase